MKNWLKWFVPSLLIGGIVTAGTIKTWANGDVLTASDINTNFQHIHNLMVGGHGARLVNADVSAGAAISTSKLAAYRLIPRTWAFLSAGNSGCGTAATACTETSPSGTTIVGTAAGTYAVTFGYTATNATYAPLLTVNGGGGGTTLSCVTGSLTTTGLTVYCENDANPPAAADTGFTIVIYDDD